ncbi:MAG: aminotransferase class IV [Pseudomonadota bacterium]|nr:aminotransferase class IV [Pseudomonadota bacterium]
MNNTEQLTAGAAWMGGEIMPLAAARLPVNDWGIIHSDITYDVVPVWDGGFFRLDDYLARFGQSMAASRMDVGMSLADIRAALTDMVAASGLRAAYVAMVASRGVPLIPGTRDPRECGNHFYAWCVPYIHIMRPELPTEKRTAWIAKTVTRIPEASINPRVKNYHWGDFTAGLFEAKDNGYETVILLDAVGQVTEGPGFNVFAVKDGGLITSDHGMLEGISRRTVLEMAAEAGMTTEIRPLPLSEFMESDEVFLSSSGGGVIALTRVDDRIFGNGAAGPVATLLHERYWNWMGRPEMRTEITYPAPNQV